MKKNAQKISAAVEWVTPELAQEYLDANHSNYRILQPRYAQRLADLMKDGQWDANGEPIIFDDNGRLLDGQHRLKAVTLAGVSIEMLIVRGVESRAAATMDTGRRRTLAQLLASRGVKFSNHVAAVARTVMAYEFGERDPDIFRQPLLYSRILGFLKKDGNEKTIEDLIHELSPARRFCSLSLLASAAMLGMRHYGRTKAMEWALNVANTSGPVGSPAQLLTKRLLEEHARASSGHANRYLQLILMMRSMKAHCEGIDLVRLQFGKGRNSVLPEIGKTKES